MSLGTRARALLSLVLSALVISNGFGAPANAFVSLVDNINSDADLKAIFVIASMFPLAVALWSLALAWSTRGRTQGDTELAMAQAAFALAIVGVVCTLLVVLATVSASIDELPVLRVPFS
jgi:type III secretory pathway component EscU